MDDDHGDEPHGVVLQQRQADEISVDPAPAQEYPWLRIERS
jgi:hypothetical protein